MHERVKLESDGRSSMALRLSKPTGVEPSGFFEFDFGGNDLEELHVDNLDNTHVTTTHDGRIKGDGGISQKTPVRFEPSSPLNRLQAATEEE